MRENIEEETENETRSTYTPTKSVTINSTHNDGPNVSRNMVTGVLTDSTNQPKKPKIRFQSQPASKVSPAVALTGQNTFCTRKERQHHAAYVKSSNGITHNVQCKM